MKEALTMILSCVLFVLAGAGLLMFVATLGTFVVGPYLRWLGISP